MLPVIKTLWRRWHSMLGLSRQSPPSWYADRVREEFQELREARTPLERPSETSDVFFSISRADHDGFPVQELPQFAWHHVLIYAYMLAKFTSRWLFYQVAAFLCQFDYRFTGGEVVNPSKDSKMDQVASRHGLDPVSQVQVDRSSTPTGLAAVPVTLSISYRFVMLS
ncbi:hypothetical protein GGR52DRAFT_572829 [Hypoxylon sp. FL1284]|nr:hypothetical protein GGR52DRAFT_572829 [Hypoxylon sp. FL1284]